MKQHQAISMLLRTAALVGVLAALALPFLPGAAWGFWALDGRGSLKFAVYMGALLATPALLLDPRGRKARSLVLLASLVLFGFLQWASPRSIQSIENVFFLLGADRPVHGWAGHLVRPLAILGLGALFGRYFCGWLCPMGALQEVLHRAKLRVRVQPRLDRVLKYGKYVTAVLLVLAPLLFQAQPVSEADPFTPVFGLQRGLRLTATTDRPAEVVAYGQARNLEEITDSAPGYTPALLSFMLLVLVASIFVERPFCRYLCPVGGLLALLARFAPARVVLDARACVSCGDCASECPVDAIRMHGQPARPRISTVECIACRECEGVCPTDCLNFGAIPPRASSLAGPSSSAGPSSPAEPSSSAEPSSLPTTEAGPPRS